jgi:phosphoserine aminotransferase
VTRAANFSAGPAAMPLEVLQEAQAELLDFEGTGMSIMEQSHRAPPYDRVHQEATDLVVRLLGVPDTHDVLFLQGGASLQFAQVPLNLRGDDESADYVLTGVWAEKAYEEASVFGKARVAYDARRDGQWQHIPDSKALNLDPRAAYVHITSNNTIAGTQWREFPDTGAIPLVADMSSDIFSRSVDVSKFGLIYAGAQKNLGPSGVTLVIVAKSLLKRAGARVPRILRYATHAEARSLYNTPPTFAIYLVRGVLRHLATNGGVAAAQKNAQARADQLYAVIDATPDLFHCPVATRDRSLMNVVFRLPSADLERQFLKQADAHGLVGLKGHRLVGGLRASLYNAVETQWVDRLCAFMRTFAAETSARSA